MKKTTYSIALTVLVLLTHGGFASASETQPIDVTPTIAILDTAIQSSNPMFNGRIIFEACVTQWSSCPNGMREMEGTNSALVPTNFISRNGFDHGTQMASLAIATNPKVQIVFVRIIGMNSQGFRQASGEITVYQALDWVLRNREKFNIQAVSLSQGHHNLGPAGTDYCPKTPITEQKIQDLVNLGVPVFVSAGNGRDYSRIDWPACIPSAIAMGATMPTKSIAIYSNFDEKLIDFFAQGTTRALNTEGRLVNVAGTSASTVIGATQWATVKAAKPNLTYFEIYDLLSKTSTSTWNSKIKAGRLINLEAALEQLRNG
jgi:serine protease